jgi:phosphoenolpyruvate carboxylase
MDGNPNVGADTLRAALARQRELVLERYRREATELSRRLSQSGALTGVSDDIRERVAAYGDQFPKALAAIPTRYHDMPYRVLLALMAARLEATRRDDPNGYLGAVELEGDLGAVIASLRAHRGEHAGLFGVMRLLRRVETFGFHLATIDVRQHAHVHRAVVGTLLGDPTWPARPQAERLARLRQVLERGELPSASPDAEAARTLEVFKAIAECRARYGPHAVGPYIISMAQGPMMSSPCWPSRGGAGSQRQITYRWTSRRCSKPWIISRARPPSCESCSRSPTTGRTLPNVACTRW